VDFVPSTGRRTRWRSWSPGNGSGIVEIIRREQPVFDGLPELVEKLSARYALALASVQNAWSLKKS